MSQMNSNVVINAVFQSKLEKLLFYSSCYPSIICTYCKLQSLLYACHFMHFITTAFHAFFHTQNSRLFNTVGELQLCCHFCTSFHDFSSHRFNRQWRCDSDDDCGDMTDEVSCTAPPPGSPCQFNEFRCSSGDRCIPKGKV